MSDVPASPNPLPTPWSSGGQPRSVVFSSDQELLVILPNKADPVVQKASIIEITESGQLWLISAAPDNGKRLVAIYASRAWLSVRPLSGS